MSDLLERLSTDVGGRYVIEGELGRGGMATVYLARDLMDEKRVAIKVLDPELAAAVGGERFRREIEIARRLQHPNILGIHEHGEAAGSLYYVMPYVQGESLRARLDREKQLPVEEAVRYACEVADALAYAHAQGVVHRDIKPENVLLENGHAVVADFGIARAASAADTTTLTKTGVAIGTPQYMSPEQIFGEKDIDGRTDEYALGCMLHEMLAGQPPFVGPHAQSLMAQHALDEPPLVTRFRPSTPTHVEDALLTALAKTRADRFPTLGEFAAALRKPGTHTSMMRATRTRAVPAPAPRAPVWKRAIPLAAAMLLGTAATAGAYFFWVKPNVTQHSAEEAAAARKIAVLYFGAGDPSLASLADGLTETLIQRLRDVSALDVRSSAAVAPYRDSRLATDSLGRLLGVSRVVRGKVREDGDRLRVDVSFIDAESGAELEGVSIAQPRGDVLAMRAALADSVEALLRRRVGSDVRLREQRASTSSVEAWTVLQRAERVRKDADSIYAAGDPARAGTLLASSDSLAAQAAALDDAWSTPHTLRAGNAIRRAEWLGIREPQAAASWLDSAVMHADAALALDPRDADARERRGTARFITTRLGVLQDTIVVSRLLGQAEADLDTATQISPTQASAYNVLSRLKYASGEVQEAGALARRALETDAYLASAGAIQYRIFVTAYDVASFPEARTACAQGARRFPADPKFVECALLLLIAPDSRATPDSAWRLLGEYERRVPKPEWEYYRRYAQVFIAGALGRSGLRDSAEAVLVRSRADASIDPRAELAGMEALVRGHIGDQEGAIRLLQRYIADHPEHRKGFTGTRNWWWEPLRADPRFKAIARLTR